MTQHRCSILLVCLAWLVTEPSVATAQHSSSLWSRRRANRVYLFYDTSARQPGDLITIVLSENTTITNRDQRALSKDSATGATLGFTGSTGGDFGSTSATANLDHASSSDRTFNGDARFNSLRGFSDRLTVTVQAVLPNGNMWVAGRRQVLIEGDERSLLISGVVRPLDVRADNTISSQLVSDLSVRYCGRGAESRFTHQGWLNRKVNRFWPF